VDCADLTEPDVYERWQEERVDTIVCSNVLEHLEPDQAVLHSFYRTLVRGGRCVVVVPAGQWLYTGIDREFGHYRRYSRRDLASKMTAAGFEIAYAKQFNRLGALAWAVSGHVLGQRDLSPRQMVWFDRLLPLVKILEWILPVPGLSLIIVGRKPGGTPQTAQDVQARKSPLCEVIGRG
jgi:SAM-dependent methyltransferase